MFLKKDFLAKRKNNPKLVYPGIRYAHEKKLNFLCKKFFTKFDLRLKKKHETLAQFKITKGNFKIFFCCHQKMLVIQFSNMEIV